MEESFKPLGFQETIFMKARTKKRKAGQLSYAKMIPQSLTIDIKSFGSSKGTLLRGKPSSLNKALRSTPPISESNLRSDAVETPIDSSLLTLIGEVKSSGFLKELSTLQGSLAVE